MPKQTISFTIEEEQLTRLDALAEKARLNRSIVLGILIDAGMSAVEQPIRILTDRDEAQRYAVQRVVVAIEHPLPDGAFPCADADQAA